MSASHRDEVRAFLTSRRARLTPADVGLPPTSGHRRVPGLRRDEVAVVAGVSGEYYARLERGDLAGVSEDVLEAISRALRLDRDEHEHLLNTWPGPPVGPPDADDRGRPRRHRCASRCSACWTP